MKTIVIIALVLLCLFLINKFLAKFKFPKIGAICVFVGGVKSGKSAVSVGCAISNYKRALRSWRLSCFFRKFFNLFRRNKLVLPEKPLLYSSIPISGFDYVPLTRDHLLRKKRFNYKSVVLIDEASLVADSQLIKDKDINTSLLLFFKLFGHETHGGKCIVNTHCISDLHYALKRTTSQYFYLHHLSKYIPLFTLAYVREERYSEDGATVNAYNDDVEDSMKRVIMRSSIFKRYDPFCFSTLTDDLPVQNDTVYIPKGESLKADYIVSFRPEFYLLRFGKTPVEFDVPLTKEDCPESVIDKITGEVINLNEVINNEKKDN